MAACLALTGLVTVVVLAKTFGLDKGLAAGVAAGGLTQSAIIGTAGDAIARLGLDPAQVKTLQQNVAIGYAVTYVFGSFGAIIICVNVLPWFMKKSIRDDALQAEISQVAGRDILNPGEELALRKIIGRVYRLKDGVKKSVSEFENAAGEMPVTVERVKRGKQFVDITPDLQLAGGDLVLLVGGGEAVRKASEGIVSEVYGMEDMDVRMLRHDVMVTAEAFAGKSVEKLKDLMREKSSHGIYITGVQRKGKPLAAAADTELHQGDVLTIYGSERDVNRAVSAMGHAIVKGSKTDFIYLGLGMVVGFLIGIITVRVFGLPLTLGSGGGALLAGLVFGWYRTRRPDIGYMPDGAIQILKDLGLAGFVVIVGLSSGLQAVETVREKGLSIFLIGALVTIIPLLITMVIGKYIIGYKNTAVMAGALSGSRSANPAFGEILNKAGNSVPTVPFAITYALANVFLTLLGPLIVSLV
jgi:aspartate-alanine antiporter